MPVEKIIILEDIGEVSLKRDRRFKHLSIRMAPNKGIWINLPADLTYQDGIDFANQNKEWILNKKYHKDFQEKKNSIFSEENAFQTKFHRLKLTGAKTKTFSASLHQGLLNVIYPNHLPIENDQLQNFIRNSIIETLGREANYYLPKRISILAEKHGFTFKSIKIKNTKSRWGSCTYDNKINLSLHLMRLPEELSDMVILHELCHTMVKNHSKCFWDLLENYCDDLSRKRKEIKKYSTQII